MLTTRYTTTMAQRWRWRWDNFWYHRVVVVTRHGGKVNKTNKSNNKKINQNGHANTIYAADDVQRVRFVISHVAVHLCGVYPEMIGIYYCFASAKFDFRERTAAIWKTFLSGDEVAATGFAFTLSTIYFMSPTVDVFRYNCWLTYTDIPTNRQN